MQEENPKVSLVEKPRVRTPPPALAINPRSESEVVDLHKTDPKYAKEFKEKYGESEVLFEIADHNLPTSIIGMTVSACLMVLSAYLSSVSAGLLPNP